MKIGISIVEGPTYLPPVSNTLHFFLQLMNKYWLITVNQSPFLSHISSRPCYRSMTLPLVLVCSPSAPLHSDDSNFPWF